MSRTFSSYTGYIYEVRMVLEEEVYKGIYQPMGFAFDEYEAISYARWLSEKDDVSNTFIMKQHVIENNREGQAKKVHTFIGGLEIPRWKKV